MPNEAPLNYSKQLLSGLFRVRFSMESKGKCQLDFTNASEKWFYLLFPLLEKIMKPSSPHCLLIIVLPDISKARYNPRDIT